MASVSLLIGISFETDDEGEAKPKDLQVDLMDQVFETDDEAKPKAGAKAEAKAMTRAKPKVVPKPDEAEPKARAKAKVSGLKKRPSSACTPEPGKARRIADNIPTVTLETEEPKVCRNTEGAKVEPPSTSGAFDFARWVLLVCLGAKELDMLRTLHVSEPLQVGSICTGMATETLALEAIRRSCPSFNYTVAFVCEKEKAKMKQLKVRHPLALHVNDVAFLSESKIRNSDGRLVERPAVDLLISGFSCKSISKMNMKPESVLGKGSTGTTLAWAKGFRQEFGL